MEIKDITDLKKYLSQDWLLDGKSGMEKKFEELAKILLEEVAIKKGDKLYFIKDIEFYFYYNDHKDIVTYPRNCKAGEWFFNPTGGGVDIAFESHVDMTVNSKHIRKPELNDNAKFGGILLREIYPADGNVAEDGAVVKLDGPMKLLDELFNNFDALDTPKDFPVLVYDNTQRGKAVLKGDGRRYNLLGSKKDEGEKVKSIMYNYNNDENFIEREGLVSSFHNFLDAKYHFVLSYE